MACAGRGAFVSPTAARIVAPITRPRPVRAKRFPRVICHSHNRPRHWQGYCLTHGVLSIITATVAANSNSDLLRDALIGTAAARQVPVAFCPNAIEDLPVRDRAASAAPLKSPP